MFRPKLFAAMLKSLEDMVQLRAESDDLCPCRTAHLVFSCHLSVLNPSYLMQVVQAIGAPESEALNLGNPKKIDGDGAIALVDAATALGIDQYVMVTSLGTAKVGFPAGVPCDSLIFIAVKPAMW